MSLKVDILCNDGSPLGVTPSDIWGDEKRIGVGGSELALLTMCEAWSSSGHQIRLYNNPNKKNFIFEQLPIDAFSPLEDRDVLITFRSPNKKSIGARGKKVWWSCDQYTVGSFAEFSQFMDKIVVISPFHQKHFKDTYQITNAIPIDLPVRFADVDLYELDKKPNRLIFTSVPDRGLGLLRRVWDKLEKAIPDIELVITSDYRLWGLPTPRNEQWRAAWVGKRVKFLGAVSRRQYLEELLAADIFAYPCSYDELFCISCAEAESFGAFPITSDIGALATTNLGHIVYKPVDSDTDFLRSFSDKIIDTLRNREQLETDRAGIIQKSWERFRISNILSQWDEKVFD